MRDAITLAVAGALLAACASTPDEAEPTATLAQLRDPGSCAGCHPSQHGEWSGSMHAYSSLDPVFRAMNARGQRETQGALGDFCVRCHAPVAHLVGATSDGLNLDEVPDSLQGVGCFYCHSVTRIDGTHNAALTLASDRVLRGPLTGPVKNSFHRTGYSRLLDRDEGDSAALCGACHDVVTPPPASVALERGYAEWQDSLFAGPVERGGLTCNGCHMTGRDGVAAEAAGVPLRRVYSHTFPGVDQALVPFPDAERQQAEIQRELDATVRPEVCVADVPGGHVLYVTLENIAAGHRWPSGAAHDRRAWVELVASAGGVTTYQSGVLPDGGDVTALADPDLWLLRDRAYKGDGSVAHMFWDVARTEADTIPAPITFDPTDPDFYVTHAQRRYPAENGVVPGAVDRIELTLRMVAVGRDVLDDLVASGDLAPEIAAAMPVHDLLPTRAASPRSLVWTPELAASSQGYVRTIDARATRCVTNGARPR